jgi:hypothetical protein
MPDHVSREELPGHVLDLVVPEGSSRLVVLFPPMGVRPGKPSAAWGVKFVTGQRMAALCVTPRRNDWYRAPELLEWFGAGRFHAIARDFDAHSFYGISMGGYAACAYSASVPGSTVLAYAPQSTLSPALVPWERRYPEGTRQDWSGPWADAALTVHDAARAVIVFDPFARNDLRHAKRMEGSRTWLLRGPFLGHHIAQPLSRLGVLKKIFTITHEPALEPHSLPSLMRGRKNDPTYLVQIARAPRTPWPLGLAAVAKAASLGGAEPAVVMAEAEVRFRAGQWDDAAQLANRVAGAAGGTRYVRHGARIMIARCLAASGDRGAATGILEDVLSEAEDYRARSLLARIGGGPSAGRS